MKQVVIRLALLLACACVASPVHAACNLIPGTEKTFDSALGATNRPFAAPGEPLEVRLRPCDTASTAMPGGFTAPASDYVVTVIFRPSSFGTNIVVMSTDCSFFTAPVEAACESGLGDAQATCIPVASPADLSIVNRNGDQRLSLRFPDTDARLAPDADDRTYTGPATIAVTRTGDPLPCHLATTACKGQTGLVSCIDRFFANDGTCQTQVPQPTFGSFTALPVPNDYQRCFASVPPCMPQSPDELRVGVDAAGNALVPIDWRGILVQQNQVPVPRLLRSTIGSALLPVTLPGKSFAASYTPEGGILPPIFEPQFDVGSPSGVINLFGSADAPYTVLRIARRSETFQECDGGAYDGLACNGDTDCPGACADGINAGDRCEDDGACPGSTCGAPGTCGPTVCASGLRFGQPCNSDSNCPLGECGPALFNLTPLMLGGVGPALLSRFGSGICQEDTVDTCSGIDPCVSGPCVQYALEAQNPVPLEGLEQSADVFAFSLNEGVDGISRNGDSDTLDTVVTLRDRLTGIGQPLGAPAGCAGFTGTPEGRAVIRAHETPFSFPAVATEGDALAFLESESGSADCFVNGDADADDAILRVFKRNPGGGAPTEATAAFTPPLSVDAALVINDRSLAVSNGRVFFRAPEDGATPLTTVRVSVDSDGNEADGFSVIETTGRAFSADGRFVIFNGGASNLVTPDVGGRDIFVHDRDADEDGIYDETHPGARSIERVNETAGGVQANGGSSDQALSASGRYAVFTTNGTNLGAPIPCPNGPGPVCNVIVVKDRFTGDVDVASVSSAGVIADGDNRYPSISRDGRFVVFHSRASNLVAGDTNTCSVFATPGQCPDVFLRDRCIADGGVVAGCVPSTTRLSVDAAGNQTNNLSELASITPDGRFIVFQSNGALVPEDINDTDDIYLRDRIAGTIRMVSTGQGFLSQRPWVSGDGRFAAFETANALVAGDTNSTFDIYVRDMLTGAFDRVSVSSEGIEANDQSFQSQVSDDGRYVSFTSEASNLVPGDTHICPGFVVPGKCRDGFIHDRLTRVTRRVSLAADGAEPIDRAVNASISGDGRFVVFHSDADNLLGPGGDTNVYCDPNNDLVLDNCTDVFVRTVDPTDTAGDITGDGDVNDTVLGVLDASTSTRTTLCPSASVAVVAGTAAFLRPEVAGAAPDLQTPAAGVAGCPAGVPVSGGISLNSDGDSSDDVAHFWPGTGPVQNLARAAVTIDAAGLCTDGRACRVDGDCATAACTPTWIAALVSEAQQGATSLNGDGDADDNVLQVHRIGDPPTAWTNIGEAADALDVVGDIVAFITPEADQSKKLNGDSDTGDRVTQVYDAAAGKLINLKQAAEELVVGAEGGACTNGPLVALRTREASQGGTDLNEDGDATDDVLQVWSKGTGLINTRQAITPCRLEACDPRGPYRVLGTKVKFLTFEPDQGADLNGDGDQTDLILQQFEVCTRTITVVGSVDEDAGGANDPLTAEPDQPVLITKAGRCYDGMTLLLVPASCLDDGECPDGATCEDESIVATFREVTTRDIVLQPPKALAIKIGAGTATASKTLKVKLYSADPRGSGQPIPVRLTVADGDCPPGTVAGLPDLDSRTDGIQDSVLLVAAKTAKAVVTLQLAAADFATHNAKAPARCRLELSATILSEDNEDPTPRNNVATVEVNVIDLNDTGSTATHESVIASTKPLKLKVGTTGTVVKNVKVTLTNADFLPTAEAGHDVIVTADDGDCPAGTVGAPVPASSLVGGGDKATVVVPVTATGAAFNTPNKKAPSRCTAVITTTTDVMGNVEPDTSNNTTHLVIDVIDKAD